MVQLRTGEILREVEYLVSCWYTYPCWRVDMLDVIRKRVVQTCLTRNPIDET